MKTANSDQPETPVPTWQYLTVDRCDTFEKAKRELVRQFKDADDKKEKTDRRINQILRSNAALENQIDRYRIRIAELEGYEPPISKREAPRQRTVDLVVDWAATSVVKRQQGDTPWMLVSAEGYEINEYRSHPSDPESVPGYWAPMHYRTKSEAMREMARRADSSLNA